MSEQRRIRFIERAEPPQTPEQAKRRRANGMVGFGGIALIWGVVALGGGSPLAFVLVLLGIALLVGGLIVRP